MLGRSATSGTRRRKALLQICCAPLALTLLLSALERSIFGQAPVLGSPATAVTEGSATPTLPPPEPPQPTVPRPVPPTRPQESVLATPVEGGTAPEHRPKAGERKAPKPTEDLAAALEHPGELNLHGVTLDKALFMIGEQWNINIVAGDVKGTVNGTFKQAPLREILDAILLSNGYNYRAVGKSLVVSSIEQLGQINPFFQSAIIPVQSADIDEVVTGANLLKTPKGEVRPIKSAKSIVVLDFPDRVKMIRDFVATIDNAGSGRFASAESRNGMPLEVLYYRTQHISAKSAEQALQSVMSKAGRATALDKEDRLLVTDYSDNLEMVEKVLKSIDSPRPQVRITALMYDISLEDIEKLGINWNQSIHGRPDSSGKAQSVIGVDSVTQVPFTAGTAGSALTFMNLSKHFDITAVVQALQTASDARLLARPNVAVLENEEAIFEKVEEIPYQQLTQTQQGGSIGTTAFKKAGIELHVTPKIAAEGIIRMMVNPKVSRLVGFTPGDNQPIIDTSSTATVLSIGNRQTVVIGGLMQRDDVGKFNGIPYLKDLNVVGRLFRSRDLDVREGELVVFISPEIIGYSDEPTCRQKTALETIRCRMDQVPEAEGCPPCCRRLPLGSTDGTLPAPDQSEEHATGAPAPEQDEQERSSKTQPSSSDSAAAIPYSLEPLSAARIPSAEFQFGVAGRNVQTRNLVNDGRLRRLPAVVPMETQVALAPSVGTGIFAAPQAVVPSPTPIDSNTVQTAERGVNDSIWR